MNYLKHKVRFIILLTGLTVLSLTLQVFVTHAQVSACTPTATTICPVGSPPKYACGADASGTAGASRRVYTSINIGCAGQGNAILDATFAIIRLLSVGVGVVLTASMVYAGLMYITARDDPHAVGAAKERIQSNLAALLLFIFAAALLGWLLPAGILK